MDFLRHCADDGPPGCVAKRRKAILLSGASIGSLERLWSFVAAGYTKESGHDFHGERKRNGEKELVQF